MYVVAWSLVKLATLFVVPSKRHLRAHANLRSSGRFFLHTLALLSA